MRTNNNKIQCKLLTLVKCPSRDTGKWKDSGIERGSIQGERDGKFKAYGENNVEKVIEGSDNAIVQMVMLLGACQ